MPYTDAEDAALTFSMLCLTHSSSRSNVKSTMTSMAKRGSAAQWVIRSAA